MARKTKHPEIQTKEFKVYFPFTTKDVACEECGTMPCTCENSEGKVIKIQGYANFCKDASSETDVFVDHCGDVMVPEGFDLSVWNKNPQVLWQHNREYTIGKGLQAVKQKDGLVVTCEIHEKAMEEQDFYKIEQGLVTMFSVGFRTLKGEWKVVNDREVFFITKALLYEVSVVSIPMNSESQFSRIKSFEDGSFSAGDLDQKLSPESSLPAKEATTKSTYGDDTMKIKLRDMFPADKVKELEELGLGETLDELKDIDTKFFIETLVNKQFATLKTEIKELITELTKSVEPAAEEETAEELPATEEAPEEVQEEENAEEKEAQAVAVKSLSDDVAKLLALATAE